jgi:hypothetical protein
MTTYATTSRLASSSDGRGPALSETIGEWAARNPRIRRVWVAASRASGNSDETLPIALELQPVGDSEETIAQWIAHGKKWRRELQASLGRPVDLEWLDPDAATTTTQLGFGEANALVYERAQDFAAR